MSNSIVEKNVSEIVEDDVDEKKLEMKKTKLEQLKKMKEKYSRASKYNCVAVEMEARRRNSDAYANHEAKKEWMESKEKERKDLRTKGITDKNSHLLETAEVAQKRQESKSQKEKNRINNYGWNIFNEDAIYRGYEKRLKNLPTTPEAVAEYDETAEDFLDYGVKSRVSEEAIDRLVNDQKKQEEKNKNFSKRKTFYQQEEVDYINERNRVFNRKLGRYYDRFTTDIRANLERGTAL